MGYVSLPEGNIESKFIKVWKMIFLLQMDDFQVPAVNFPGCHLRSFES